MERELMPDYGAEEFYRCLIPENVFDGYEDALIGVCHRFGREPIAIYDMDQRFDTLMAEGIDYDAASDHFFTNTMGTWAGDKTPAFLKRFE